MKKTRRRKTADPKPSGAIRDRIKQFRRVKAKDLTPSPRNWRTHPKGQVDAMRGILAEIGYADATLARELPDGTLELIDGHLRQSLDPDQEIPTLILDLNEDEARKLMTVLDPLAALAETNQDALGRLIQDVSTEDAGLQAMLDDLARQNDIDLFGDRAEESPEGGGEEPPAERFGVFVACADENAQRELLERLTREGYECRGLTV